MTISHVKNCVFTKCGAMVKFIITIVFLSTTFSFAEETIDVKNIKQDLNKCEWDNRNDLQCVKIIKPIPNTSRFSKIGLKSYTITSREIKEYGATDINEIMEMIPGINVTQSGPRGQQTSLFIRGTNSNHTLVLLNGIPINDQSTTQGLHDFGVDFIQSIHQVEVYVGPNGVHFGPSAIGGAINFITTGDFANNLEIIKGVNEDNKTVSANYTRVTDNDWILNVKGGLVNSKTKSAV